MQTHQDTTGHELNSRFNVKYLIIDFSCGRFFTHHSSYLKDYESFLSKAGFVPEVWVNSSADAEVLEFIGRNTKRISASPLYYHTKESNLTRFVLNKLISVFFSNKIIAKIQPDILERLKSLVANVYLFVAYRELNRLSREFEKVRIVFPTLDALGLRFSAKILGNPKFNVDLISLRLTGAEKRGSLSITNGELVLKSLCKKFPGKIRIGYEVKSYEKRLLDFGVNSNVTYWAPMPHIERISNLNTTTTNATVKYRIGFLGSARKNKGFDEIPSMLASIISAGIDFQAFIQLPKFEWFQGNKTITRLNSEFKNYITFVPSASSKELIDNTIASMDLLILPYTVADYKYAGSGILFIASDFKVPVVTNSKMAFAWDIENFGIGITYNDNIEIPQTLVKCHSKKTSELIDSYNIARNLANKQFLSF